MDTTVAGADTVELLISDAGPELEGDHHKEHRAMAAIEELFLLDQLWRTVSGIQAQREGRGFLAGYSRYGRDITREFTELAGFTEGDWREIFGIPPRRSDGGSAAGARDGSRRRPFPCKRRGCRGNRRSEHARDRRSLPAARSCGRAGPWRSFRDINNAYRHGSRVLYEDCSPDEIPWRAANPAQAEGLLLAADEVVQAARADTVNVLLEGPDDQVHASLRVRFTRRRGHHSLLEGTRTLGSSSGVSSPRSSSRNSREGTYSVRPCPSRGMSSMLASAVRKRGWACRPHP